MSTYYGGWAPYVPVAERRRRAELVIQRLRKAGDPVVPVTIAGRLIATTFWGRAWCDNMESYHDYENRLPRGRTYVRNGSVLDLQIARGRITALVCGSELYRITVTVTETARTQWRAICADCTGGIDSLIELLQGRLSKGVMERLCRQESGLFPRPADVRFSCSCPDHALMCKHVAAVLYGVGARLDHAPELLFRLRAVDETDLVARIDTGLALAGTRANDDKTLQAEDVPALFGLDMAEAPVSAQVSSDEARSSPRGMAPLTGRATAAVAAANSRSSSSRPPAPTKRPALARKAPTRAAAPTRATTLIGTASLKALIPKRKRPTAQKISVPPVASKSVRTAKSPPDTAAAIWKPEWASAAKMMKPKPHPKVRSTVRPAKRAG